MEKKCNFVWIKCYDVNENDQNLSFKLLKHFFSVWYFDTCKNKNSRKYQKILVELLRKNQVKQVLILGFEIDRINDEINFLKNKSVFLGQKALQKIYILQ